MYVVNNELCIIIVQFCAYNTVVTWNLLVKAIMDSDDESGDDSEQN